MPTHTQSASVFETHQNDHVINPQLFKYSEGCACDMIEYLYKSNSLFEQWD